MGRLKVGHNKVTGVTKRILEAVKKVSKDVGQGSIMNENESEAAKDSQIGNDNVNEATNGIDKSWLLADRRSKEYEVGVNSFLNFTRENAPNLDIVHCPCKNCGNMQLHTMETIKDHLFCNGIDQSYDTWTWHGERIDDSSKEDKYEELDEDNLGEYNDALNTVEMVQAAENLFESDSEKFVELLEDAKKPLYNGCLKFTRISALVRLFNLKAKHGWSDTSFDDLLKLLVEMLPLENVIPSSMYEAKKTLCSLGMQYEKIHACPNDCILYRKDNLTIDVCPVCDASRWKIPKGSKDPKVGVPAKVLWYFPPIPRFKRMYATRQIAKDLTWHDRDREVDEYMRHPADAASWKLIDHKWPDFANEPRNLRLALAADGINPFSSLSSRHSTWPVILVTYNLPPWLCMKRKFMMLTLLISGPKQPGNDIDVFLKPLVEDLTLLWKTGVKVFDAHLRETFTLKAVLLWTINDFPAYGNLSGCSVKGYLACPICGEDTHSVYLKHSRKVVYQGHRRFLHRSHPYRRAKKAFNGLQEFGDAPKCLSGSEVLRKASEIGYVYGKCHSKKSKQGKADSKSCWKKRSIFFDLEYWEFLHVRHVLDVMHIEKNVCESIIGTLLDVGGKSKDGVKIRLDLVDMGIREELQPVVGEKKTFLPHSSYTLSKAEKIKFCKMLSTLKVPDGYSSNIRNCVSMEELKLFGLKSHDYHTLMQHILPLALRGLLDKKVRCTITRLCFFFNALCSKVVDVSSLKPVQDELIKTMCLLEKNYPPSFFDIMVHLTVHLIREVQLCGPVYLRWMYQFERCMKVFKNFVRNRNRPEGCIAECYIAEEAVEYCSEYLSCIDTIGVAGRKNDTGGDIESGKPISGAKVHTPDPKELNQAHLYVLENTSEIDSYIQQHMEELKDANPSKIKNQKWLQDEHNRSFIDWLREKVAIKLENDSVSEILRWISHGPQPQVLSFEGYIVNGIRFYTKKRDDTSCVQNSGVTLLAKTMQVSSSKDKNPIIANMSFFGVIKEIWQLDYVIFKVVIFKCDWVESSNGVREDDGYTLVDLSKIGHKSDPFILADQAQQIFYVQDGLDPLWSIVVKNSKNDFSAPILNDDLGDTELDRTSITKFYPDVESFDVADDSNYLRRDEGGTWIENI